jgi:CRISPR-associated exonuclease Cas4
MSEETLSERFSEDELVALSALQHMVFCPRQCGLIHLEQIWHDNRLTAEGHVLHRKVHEPGRRKTGEVYTVRSLQLHSLTLGVAGIADAVEFHPCTDAATSSSPLPTMARQACDVPRPAGHVPGLRGRWLVVPVEYKRGRPKKDDCDRVQLCAQAVCLEEMLDCRIVEGSLVYGQTRRRTAVAFDQRLRDLTFQVASQLHEMMASGTTPPPVPSPKCERCSLLEVCLPRRLSHPNAGAYLKRVIFEALKSENNL